MAQAARQPAARRTLGGCCLATFWSGAIAFGYPGIMGAYWQQAFGATSAQTGLVVTLMLLGIALCTIVSGRFLERFGMRACVATGTLLMVAALAVLMAARGIGLVYAWAFLVSFGSSFVYGPGLTTVQRCLPARKGLASGLINVTFGLSAALMSPVWEAMLGSVGYGAVNASLVVCIVVTNGAAWLLVGGDGTPVSAAAASPSAAGTQAEDGLTVAQAVPTRAFWLLWLAWAFVGAAGISMVSLAKSYSAFLGLSSVAMLTAFNITNGAGRLVAGLLCDAVGGELTALTAFAAMAAGYALLPLAPGVAGAAVLAACVGYGFGALFATCGPIATRHFGMACFGRLFGFIFAAYGCVGGVIGPLLAGVVLASVANPYPVVFGYLALFALVGAAAMALLRWEGPVEGRAARGR